MTQEEKRELEIALSGYYPYGVYVEKDGYPMKVHDLYYDCSFMLCDEGEAHFCGGDISKMYLRPMSSMTKDEENEYLNVIKNKPIYCVNDWLNENHLDYRGFIERGLAIAVTEKNNPYKEEDDE